MSASCTHAMAAIAAAAAAAAAQPTFHRIAMSGEPFPGRPGSTYSTFLDNTFLGPRSIDSEGNVYFQAAYANDGASDLLVYDPVTREVKPFLQSGFALREFPSEVFWGVVGGPTPGMMAHVPLAQDPVLGPRLAVVVSRTGGASEVMGMELDQPPGYDEPAGWFGIGISGGAALDVNMNRFGAVSFGGFYLDQQGETQYGIYRTFPGGAPEVLMDSLMAVPGHDGAHWVAYDGWLSPFDPQGAGIDDAGNAYFRAKYQAPDARQYRAFYERAVDGSLVAVADAGSGEQVPGRPPGARYGAFKAAMNNRVGDVAFSAESKDANGIFLGMGTYLKRAGGGLGKLIDSNDPVPGVPEAIGNQPYLAGMTDSGFIAIANNHGLQFDWGKGYAYSLTLLTPEGWELVLRFDQLPGLPGVRSLILGGIEVNEHGDVVFTAYLSAPDNAYAAYAYLNDTDTLVPILKTGDTLDGMKVLGFFDTVPGLLDPSGEAAVTGGPVTWTDDRRLTVSARLDAGGGKQVAALYAVDLPVPCRADIDENGTLDLFDFLGFVNLFNDGDPAADWDGNGAFDLFDFLGYVNAFNAGC